MIIEEKLYLDLPDRKPPFIGIAFGKDASNFAKRNNGFFNLAFPKIDVLIEQEGPNLLITLLLRKFSRVTWYQPTYQLGELRAWIKAARTATAVNFGHVMLSDDGTATILKEETTGRPMFFAINRLIFIDAKAENVIRLQS